MFVVKVGFDKEHSIMTKPGSEQVAETEVSVPDLYSSLTERFLKALGDDLPMIHFGLWGPDTETLEESFLHSINVIAGDCGIGPGKRVLDAGCGLGGPAVAVAREYGAHVTGLTNCEPHVAVGTDVANRQGVGHLVDFRHGDFMDMPFPDESFDAVLNHESFCYVPDAMGYLKGVYRILRPGGCWRLMDGLRTGKPMNKGQMAQYSNFRRGWVLPQIQTLHGLRSVLEQAGFEGIMDRDLDPLIMPYIENFERRYKVLVLMSPPLKLEDHAYHKFLQAAFHFGQGIQEGVFTYRLVSGWKPRETSGTAA